MSGFRLVPSRNGSFQRVTVEKKEKIFRNPDWIIVAGIVTVFLAAVIFGPLSMILPVPIFASVYAGKRLGWRWRWHFVPAIVVTIVVAYTVYARWLLDLA